MFMYPDPSLPPNKERRYPMEISEETEEWLRTAGYEYYCFISYPKIHGDITRFAMRMKDAIEKQLAATVRGRSYRSC